MLTIDAAKILGVKDYGIKEGNRADLVIIDTDNIKDAIRLQPARLYAIKNEKLIAKSSSKKELFRTL